MSKKSAKNTRIKTQIGIFSIGSHTRSNPLVGARPRMDAQAGSSQSQMPISPYL
jgi:hypothetical protein